MKYRLLPGTFYAAGIAAALCTVYVSAQTPAPLDSPHFEVASLKPTPADNAGNAIIRPMPGNAGYTATNMTLRSYLMIAYVVRDGDISGAPSWFDNDRYDMLAKADKPSSIEDLHTMLANLLADRCQLKLHKEGKEVSGFNLVLDKGAPKFTAHDAADHDHPPILPAGPGKIQGVNANLDLLAIFLSRALDRPVVNKTGLPGFYDFTLELVPDPAAVGGDVRDPNQPPVPRQGPDSGQVSTALKEQLGLRLDPGKIMAQRIVIDHVEKPSGN